LMSYGVVVDLSSCLLSSIVFMIPSCHNPIPYDSNYNNINFFLSI
jgi:hypothetical protein